MDINEHKIAPPTDQESKEMWENIISRIKIQEAIKRKRKIALFSIITTAAILVIASLITYQYTLRKPDTYFAKEEMEVTLKDGSKVTLSKGAKLYVEKSFPSQTRVVKLDGEAIFKITKSKVHPFIVQAGAYQTKVLGTVFKVSQKGSSINVDLYEGKVQVINVSKPKNLYFLKPQETFSNMGSLKVAAVFSTRKNQTDIKNKTATFTLSAVALADAIKILESRYGIAVRYPADRATSPISLNKEKATAADLVRLISLNLNLKIKRINDKTFQLEE